MSLPFLYSESGHREVRDFVSGESRARQNCDLGADFWTKRDYRRVQDLVSTESRCSQNYVSEAKFWADVWQSKSVVTAFNEAKSKSWCLDGTWSDCTSPRPWETSWTTCTGFISVGRRYFLFSVAQIIFFWSQEIMSLTFQNPRKLKTLKLTWTDVIRKFSLNVTCNLTKMQKVQ